MSCRYLYDILMDVGPVKSGGFGAIPLTYGDIREWEDAMSVNLHPWERQAIRRASISYCAESVVAQEHDARAPWDEEVSPTQLRKVAGNLRARLSGLANRK